MSEQNLEQPVVPGAKVKYLTNREFLIEIHKSKLTYCSYEHDADAHYDVIVSNIRDITNKLIEDTKTRKAYLQTQAGKKVLREANRPQTEVKAYEVLPESFNKTDLVFRVITSQHIPLDPTRKRKGKGEKGNHARTPFDSFKHYRFDANDELVECLRSHWRGTIQDGEFCITHGHMTARLAAMYILLVDRYSRLANWRNYTYLDEMKNNSLLQLSQIGLMFDEFKSDNPFSFYTTTIKNCLAGDTMILTKEHGSIAIDKVANQTVHLLDGNGDWTSCFIYDHGMQETQELVFSQGKRHETIRSTGQHGWIMDDKTKITTDDLAANGWTKIDQVRPAKVIKDQEQYKKGVIHGIIYGDGTDRSTANEIKFGVRLCINKTSLASWFDGMNTACPPSNNGDINYYVNNAWANLKALPVNPGNDLDYLLGFMRGWIATDGCVAAQNSVVTVCGDPAECDWISQWAPLIGWQVGKRHQLAKETNYGTRNKDSYNLHFFKPSMDVSDLLNQRHIDRWKASDHHHNWNVYRKNNKTPVRTMERVYCPVVETTGTFALASGIHSRNCFTHILNREKRGQNLRDDILIMNGASPSYTRQNDLDYERGLKRHAAGGHGEVIHTIMPGYEDKVESAIRARAKEEEEALIRALEAEPIIPEAEEEDVVDVEAFDNGITFPNDIDDED